MAKKAKYHWVEKVLHSEQDVKAFQEETGAGRLFAQLCLQRGIDTREKLETFKRPDLSQLHDPYLMHDMEKAVERIRYAIENGEKILVYGDYDADGITSTSILCEAIDTLGGNVHFYLPNRFTDGYGPNVEVFRYMIDVDKVDLIVTCDNGVAGHEAIAVAMSKGVDVVVTDHHELPAELPNAYAIVHPRHPKGQYPFGDLSGAGVAFKVATALLDDVPMESLDLVAIGTIADLVSVTDENRILIHYGLDMLKQTQRIGLQKLMESAGVNTQKLTADSVGFAIGPRLNAIGRLDDATPGVELMMTFDDEQADELVALINAKNDERKQIVANIVNDVMQQIQGNADNFILLASKNWHAGVLGIVASQVVEKTGKPTILLQIDEETGIAKGSGRSVEGVNLYDVLTECSDFIEKFGGHEMAAGLSVSMDNIDALKHALQHIVPVVERPTRYYDLSVESSDLTIDFLHELKQFEPYGTNHDKPIFKIENEKLSQTKSIGDKKQHFKGRIGQLDFVLFNAGHVQSQLLDDIETTAWVQLGINEWNGIESVQGHVLDTQITKKQWFDKRTTVIKKEDVMIENAIYIFFNQKYYDFFATKVPTTSQSLMAETIDHHENLFCEHLVIFDCPETIELLQHVLNKVAYDNVHVMCHTQKNLYLIGTPTRQQFANVYKILANEKQVVLKNQLDRLSKVLGMQKDLLILIIQVFFEAEFVKIEDGVLTFVGNTQKVDLMQTQVMKKHQQLMAVQKELLFTPFATLQIHLKMDDNKE
ncbi:single-stranded-DNA-specific exonuclease RecJ [Carnobacteriaceae bacterium zg-ZUI252]|nr:single-stranded-DNA-specific exonuclease RecJ [Carnobacteriaceae bacterium zg-ZUI252]